MNKNEETATLAGGCFWCTEAVFQRLKGVLSVTSGYSGDGKINPTYDEVSTGKSGYIESVQIEFDPEIISFSQILDVFWNTHDPTTVDRQGNDVGPQYKSAIFYRNRKQKDAAEKSKKELGKEGVYKNPAVTKILPFAKFYPAEKYHVRFYENNPSSMYCNLVITPKVDKLYGNFGDKIKKEYLR
ncbi:MAG: Peptide methionine sulfoxide reductase [Candidatus Woesebacteria bacterium GW2011_GWA1_39_21]|uniref:Peptide methionine sulfoxide reductase MsrA n=1 Tax=Candidatus Woesebacteria bacterium GW2011_GWA1_39_21 TaxID=1618550 RepID=A0A0G0QKQ8_9BACT|nr:MAG: Peptide methionine sulfoxide reductase [Candidatus Woesebacteria bacterium GW2011_GWA1_39_21]